MRARTVRYALEGVAAKLGFMLFGALPLDLASALGGGLMRRIGPHLPVSDTARRNLARAFPDYSADRIEQTVRAMWDNIGRTAAEIPHLEAFHCYRPDGRIEVRGIEHIDRARDDGVAGIFFSGHFANFELLGLSLTQRGIDLVNTYRAANNPYVDRLVMRVRRRARGRHAAKGTHAGREIVRALRAGEHVAMLIDQKQNEGIAVPFFGHDAMTGPAVARLALKFGCPLIPADIERLEGARFRLTIHAPVELEPSGDSDADALAIMTRLNAMLEGWVRRRPEQWFWVHRRWPDRPRP